MDFELKAIRQHRLQHGGNLFFGRTGGQRRLHIEAGVFNPAGAGQLVFVDPICLLNQIRHRLPGQVHLRVVDMLAQPSGPLQSFARALRSRLHRHHFEHLRGQRKAAKYCQKQRRPH
jgi:hypothetical protein